MVEEASCEAHILLRNKLHESRQHEWHQRKGRFLAMATNHTVVEVVVVEVDAI